MGKTFKREKSFDDFGKRTGKPAPNQFRRESAKLKTLNSYVDYEGEFEDDFELYDEIDIRHNENI